jgi:hypothetical protein
LRTGQKLIISLFTTILLFVVFSFLLYTSFFDFIELNFYRERTLDELRDRTLKVEKGINDYFEESFSQVDLFFNQNFFRTVQDQTQSQEFITNQFISSDAFLATNFNSGFIRITDLEGRRLYFSTRYDPTRTYVPGNTSDVLRRQDFLINYKTIGQLNPPQPPLTNEEQSWSYDLLNKGFWIQGNIRGEDGLPLTRYFVFVPEFQLQQRLFEKLIIARTDELLILAENKFGLNYSRQQDIETLIPPILDAIETEQELLQYLAVGPDLRMPSAYLVFSPASARAAGYLRSFP